MWFTFAMSPSDLVLHGDCSAWLKDTSGIPCAAARTQLDMLAYPIPSLIVVPSSSLNDVLDHEHCCLTHMLACIWHQTHRSGWNFSASGQYSGL